VQFWYVKSPKNKIFLLKLGEHIRAIRVSKNITQEQLANEIGAEISQISRIERGIINTSIANLQNISIVLDIPLKDLLDFSSDK
jgi:transcriptional regulator with XRE-family HTH domain